MRHRARAVCQSAHRVRLRCTTPARTSLIHVSTRRAVAWRERREAGRDMHLRLCLRAWREVADGVPANRAKFAQQWRRGEDCALARRLHISDRAMQQWGEVEWLAARRVLTWMRLVRAGAVHRKRTRCADWQTARARWRMQRYYHSLPHAHACLLYTSPSPRDRQKSRMPSSA